MSYQVIARKYRPQRFEDVVGQEHVTTTLANAIRSGRIAHAYIFCGPRGTGKTTIARIFAKALNCSDGPRADFDPEDPKAKEIAEGRSLDVLEIDGASNNGVEQVRELRETARFAPATSRFKIYIIDEVHMLTAAAFNALLKTLEEPPSHVKFVFATTDPEKVLATILSRCQRFDLRRIPSALIVQHLGSIARAEGVQVSEAALDAIARGADGGMRDAESTLDQLISFCGERIEESDVLSMFGLAARGQIIDLARAILDGDATRLLATLNELAQGGKDLGRLLNDLQGHFRNLVVFQLAQSDPSLIEVSEAERTALAEQAAIASPEAVTRILEILAGAEGRLRDAAARKVFLEMTLLKALQARRSVSLDAVLKQLIAMRDQLGGDAPEPPGGSPAAAPVSIPGPGPQEARSGASAGLDAGPPSGGAVAAPVASPSPAPPPPPEIGKPPAAPAAAPAPEPAAAAPKAAVSVGDPTDLAALWDRVVAEASPITRPSLQVGRPVSLEKGTLTVGYAPAHDPQRLLVDNERTRKAIEGRLSSLGCAATVKFVRLPDDGTAQAPEPAGGAAGASRPASDAAATTAAGSTGEQASPAPKPRRPRPTPMRIDPAEFKNDPLIREALEIFRGQLTTAPEVPRQEAEAG